MKREVLGNNQEAEMQNGSRERPDYRTEKKNNKRAGAAGRYKVRPKEGDGA